MKLCLRIGVLLFVITGALSQDGFNLADAFGDPEPTPPKPKETPKKDDLDDLLETLNFGDGLPDSGTPSKPKEDPKPPSSGGDTDGFDLGDALLPGNDPKPKPKEPVVPPKGGGGGGSFDDSDLFDITGGKGYKPDGGRSGGGDYNPDGGRAAGGGGGYDPHGGADQPQEAGSGQIAGIVSAVGVALVGAASSYFAYQKKKLCFKLQGGADPESGKGQHGTHSEPQVLSNLLRVN